MRQAERAFAALEEHGLLLQQDRELPSVVTLVTGEALRSSWWSHPRGKLVFAVLEALSEHPDAISTKLLDGKVTLVHRRLWPALLAVASAREPWQMRGLPAQAGRLLERVDASAEPLAASGGAAKELERRLLVQSEQVHGASGRHEFVLQPWGAWARRAKVRALASAAAGRAALERAAEDYGALPGALPWAAAT